MDRSISKYEYRLLRLFRDRSSCPMSEAAKAVGEKYCESAVEALSEVILWEKTSSSSVINFSDPEGTKKSAHNYTGNLIVKNPSELRRKLWEYRKDVIRQWIPVAIADVLSVIAIILSIIALVTGQ